MYRLRNIKFKNHPVLGDLFVDFCDQQGNPVDTILIAGENGTGKSSLLESIYELLNPIQKATAYCIQCVEFEIDNKIITFNFKDEQNGDNIFRHIIDDQGNAIYISSVDFNKVYPFKFIFSDVDINFKSKPISYVTSLSLDENDKNQRSGEDIATQIKQLLIDIYTEDALEFEKYCSENPSLRVEEIKIDKRITRFANAFDVMFDEMRFGGISTELGEKEVYFQKFGKRISIDSLSSGEKQIVYRGCFLLKDINAISGAIVLIDEPEISLHPSWQMRIMNYYKNIFTNSDGVQTSQIFAVTHSPFIIHNDNRYNDKVLVLSKDGSGKIIVNDKAEYYICSTQEAVQDAFALDISGLQPTVYVEGETDEAYLKKAADVFAMKLPFEFKWVGTKDARGQAINTGSSAVKKAFDFLSSRQFPIINICLLDCDTKYEDEFHNNTILTRLSYYENDKQIIKGIENSFVFGDIDIEDCYYIQTVNKGYGKVSQIPEFNKKRCCQKICSLDNDTLKKVFYNTKNEIEKLVSLYHKAASDSSEL